MQIYAVRAFYNIPASMRLSLAPYVGSDSAPQSVAALRQAFVLNAVQRFRLVRETRFSVDVARISALPTCSTVRVSGVFGATPRDFLGRAVATNIVSKIILGSRRVRKKSRSAANHGKD